MSIWWCLNEIFNNISVDVNEILPDTRFRLYALVLWQCWLHDRKGTRTVYLIVQSTSAVTVAFRHCLSISLLTYSFSCEKHAARGFGRLVQQRRAGLCGWVDAQSQLSCTKRNSECTNFILLKVAQRHYELRLMFTHRRSIAERGACFQQRLFVSVCQFVCLFLCQHDNFLTIKRKMMKRGG